jgi:hypothetical protein
MPRLMAVMLALAIWFWPGDAIGQCLPTPLPTAPPPGEPSYSMNVENGADRLTLRLWRHACQDSGNFRLVLRAVPTAGRPVLQSPDFFIEQGGVQIEGILFAHHATLWKHQEIDAPVTVILGWHIQSDVPAGFTFRTTQAFSVRFRGRVGSTPTTFELDVPAGAPAVPQTPSISVVATACNPCRSGETVGFDMHVDNPGSARLLEIKGGVRFPDHVYGILSQEITVPPGASVIPLIPPTVLPMGLPPLSLTVEAALLEPELGVTLSRDSMTLQLLP